MERLDVIKSLVILRRAGASAKSDLLCTEEGFTAKLSRALDPKKWRLRSVEPRNVGEKEACGRFPASGMTKDCLTLGNDYVVLLTEGKRLKGLIIWDNRERPLRPTYVYRRASARRPVSA